VHCDTLSTHVSHYGVAPISRLLKIIGHFYKRALSKRRYCAKETYNFKELTNRSHPICISMVIHIYVVEHIYIYIYMVQHIHTGFRLAQTECVARVHCAAADGEHEPFDGLRVTNAIRALPVQLVQFERALFSGISCYIYVYVHVCAHTH